MPSLATLIVLALIGSANLQDRSASITVVAPTFGAVGTTVSIRGSGFCGFENDSPWVRELASEPPPGFVEFNGVPAEVLFWQDDLITVKVPKGASTGNISVIVRESRSRVSGGVFEVYYSTRSEFRTETAPATRQPTEQREESVNGRRSFDERTLPPYAFESDLWFSSLTPGERTFLGEQGLYSPFMFGSPFSLSGRRSTFSNGGFLSQPGFFSNRWLGRSSSPNFFFKPFLFQSSQDTGIPFWIFFNRNQHHSFRNEWRTFRR